MKPLVSIITPAYNAEKYIGEAIESVFAQTYDNWELIIIDDGSTDGTKDIAEKYVILDKRIKYYYQENQRMASARNKGINNSSGEYIAFLDADNIFSSDKLDIQVKFLEENPWCGLVYGKILHFYGEDKNRFYKNKIEDKDASGDIFLLLLKNNFINVLSVLVRKEFFDKYGAFQQDWKACDEHFVWVNLAYSGVRFFRINHVSGYLRLHKTNDSKRKEHILYTATDFLKMLDIVQSWFGEKEKLKYGRDVDNLRKEWKRKLWVGKLMARPPFSWIIHPLYLWRRDRYYVIIKNDEKK